MLYEFLTLDRESEEPLCHQLYRELRLGIENGRLQAGEKLASIRQASQELSLSRTTVENAYVRLSTEGYTESRPQSGYRVRGVLPRRIPVQIPKKDPIRFDFTTSSIDLEAADLLSWRRLVRAVLADEKAVTSYGDPQGEFDLRAALSSYSFHARGVIADPENIFIGAGIGPLLQNLCPLLPARPQVILECPGFFQAEQVFSDYGFPISICTQLPQSFPQEGNCIIAELPSLRKQTSPAAVSAHRFALAQWSRQAPNSYVLEDDYNGELRYRTRPTSSFQGICPEKTIYLGSFSKLLVPSVRIAYMVLPPDLAQAARERLPSINQTAGKTEQMALAEYIRTGLLEKHLRRLRRLYARKSQLMAQALEQYFGRSCHYTLHETSLAYEVEFLLDIQADALSKLAKNAGISCHPARRRFIPGEAPRLLIGFSGIPAEKIEPGIQALKEVLSQIPNQN